MSVAIQIWLTFALSILKDVILQFVINNEKFRRLFWLIKRRYLLIKLTYGTFLKHYKNFIREKNDIFALMMSGYKNNTPQDPIFFFSTLTQYWLLKKNLIKQYEKILNIHLVDDYYDIFEDEVKQAKVVKTKNSLKRLIWKIKMVDKEFAEMWDTSVNNLKFLKGLITSNVFDQENYGSDSADLSSLGEEKFLEIFKSYIKDESKLISQWKSKQNKIRNLDKFELYSETKLVQKYVKQLGIEIRHEDSINILRITNILNNSLSNISNSLKESGFKDRQIYRKFIKSERLYSKIYYRLLIKKHLFMESKSPIKDLSSSDASLIINKSSDYFSEKTELLKKSKDKNLSEENRWKIAYRLWELNEIRKNICIVYLDIDTDFSKWTSNYEKLISKIEKSKIDADKFKEIVKSAENFLIKNINPSKMFSV